MIAASMPRSGYTRGLSATLKRPMTRPFPTAKIGFLGGGQLVRMTLPAAARLGCEIHVLDPDPQCPANALAHRFSCGSLNDPTALRALVEANDITTYEIEAVDTTTLLTLEAEGHRILPSPRTVATIQDKLRQKEAFAEAGLATAPFVPCDEPSVDALLAFGAPLVQKARRGGYDGKGVAVFTDIIREDAILPVPSLLEAHVDFSHELAVMVARTPRGQTVCYPVVEMVFDPAANLLDTLLAPARIPAATAEAAQALALAAVEALGGVGLFGVELFLTREGTLLLNEVAPRSHNSGHWTAEACLTSQFEQHLRAILDLPLGSPEQLRPAAMLNLVAGADASGPATVTGLEEALAVPGCTVHLYGKAAARPFRKMGHATILGPTPAAALEAAKSLRAALRFGEKQ